MKTKILKIWESLTTSFWFVPLFILLIAVGLSFGFVYLDRIIQLESSGFYGLFCCGGAEGARSVLSTVASSMMTVAGIVFSITIVALSLASSQFGPRLLRNFMRDEVNQTVLGTYVATFIYCLLVLRTVQTTNDTPFVPNISVIFAVVLVIANIILLIMFIHHISASIQADRIVSNVCVELDSSIKKLFPDELGQEPEEQKDVEHLLKMLDERYPVIKELKCPKSGYLQAIDNEGLLKIAQKHDLLFVLNLEPGDFIVRDMILLRVMAKRTFEETLIAQIYDAFIFGSQRTPTQDIEFAIHQIVEVAVRALSTGINDPFTAMACTDKLGAVIGQLTNKKFPSPYRYDEQNELRVVAKSLSFTGITDAAFNQIRQYGRGSAAVLIRMMEVFGSIARLTKNAEQREAIFRHAVMVARAGQESLPEPHDKEDLTRRYQEVIERLNNE